MYTNTRVSDSVVSNEDYAKRAVELGHGIISTCEHGYQGRYIEGYELAQKYDLKFVFGVEAYWVKDRTEKDRSNCHVYIAAKNENGRQAINDILSEANITGFYGQPRIDIELILSLPASDVIVTTACIAFWKYDDVDSIVENFSRHFGSNFYLEVQYHNTDSQIKINEHILELSQGLNIQIIMGCDSHYIDEFECQERDDYLLSKGMRYKDEDGWFLDYPSGEEAYKRFANQCVLSHEQIVKAMDNTNIFLEVEEYDNPCFQQEIKMPTLYPELSQKEKDKIYSDLIYSEWEKQKHEVPMERWEEYESEIKKEIDVVIKTKHSDYFLLDHAIIKKGREMGGMITSTGRGSAVSFFTNKLLGLTDVDRISSKVKMYPERFMSATRILESKSLADIDLNLGTPDVFINAQKEIFGENHSYPMIAYGTLRPKAAWKMYSKSQNIDFTLTNEISEQIGKYEKALKYAEEDEKDTIDVSDFIDKEYRDVFLQSEKYLGVIASWSIHPCLTENALVLTEDGYKKINEISIGDMVLSHSGKFNKVLNTMSRESDSYYELKVGGMKLEVTGNHPVYVRTNTYDKRLKIYVPSEPYWKPVEELTKNDFVGFSNLIRDSKIPEFENVPTDSIDFWWIVGRYLGDGFLTSFKRKYDTVKRINISCSTEEKGEILEKLTALNIKPHFADVTKTYLEIAFYGQYMWDFLSLFGKYAHGKFIPSFVYDLPEELLKSFVDGYISADGCISGRRCSFITVSEKLAYGMQFCVQKSYKVPCTISTKEGTAGEINGKTFMRRKSYTGAFGLGSATKNKYIDKNAWVHCKKTPIDKKVKVYNIEVENDHSYTANNIIFHNCAHLLYQDDIRKEIGLIKIKNNLCCLMDGKWAEEYKFLKNDLLKVSVVELIDKTYQRIGIPKHTANQLLDICQTTPKIWDIFKTGCVLGVNQVEKQATKSRVMKFQPTNIVELCAFVAAIRPAFKSMYKIFEKRERFKYGIKSFDDLIQTPEMPNTFILYQEMSMATLGYAGISMSECYDIIKNIAKKRVDKVLKYKNSFVKGFSKALIENESRTPERAKELSMQVWQILEDSSSYGFCAAHAYCMAIDSLYSAYLKTFYPIEFYEVFLNILKEKGEKDRMNAVKSEAEEYFQIVFEPFRFRQDNRKIRGHKETNKITNSLSSIKGFSSKIADTLYDLSKFEYTGFCSFLLRAEEFRLSSKAIEALIEIDYFCEFGNMNFVSKVNEVFEILKRGNSKQVSKEKVPLEYEDIFRLHCDGVNKNGIPSKLFAILDMNVLLSELEDRIKTTHTEDLSYREKMIRQVKVLGYIDITTNRKEDRRKLVITDIQELKGGKSGKTWARAISTKSIGTGKSSRLTVKEGLFKMKPLEKSDIIYATAVGKERNEYWHLYQYDKIF